MFVCSRRGAGRPDAQATPAVKEPASAYLVQLRAMQELVAELLHVHSLSPAIQYEAQQGLTVDGGEWWKEVEAQGAVAAQTRTRAANGRVSSTPNAAVEALAIVLQSLDRVSRRQRKQQENVPSVEATGLTAKILNDDSIEELLASVEGAVGVAGASALRKLFTDLAVSSAVQLSSNSRIPVNAAAAAVINQALQFNGVGSRHAFHNHALISSIPRRSFGGRKYWECGVCNRSSPTSMPDGQAPPVYRCAACDFNLCRECFTRVPNTSYLRSDGSGADRVDSSRRDTVERFFSLSLPGVLAQSASDFRLITTKLSVELRRRLLEVYPHQPVSIVPFVRILLDMFRNPHAAYEMVSSPELPWFPPFSRTWTMSMHTLLGPFLRATTMLKNAHEIDHAIQSKKAPKRNLRLQWQSGYHEVRRYMHEVMRTLLADSQHPFVVDATMCWIGLTLLAADLRRRMNYDTKERMDGFLINLTSMLIASVMPAMQQAQKSTQTLDISYHQVVEPVRAYASKDFPEVPLRHVLNGDEESEALLMKARQDEEEACIRERDRQSIHNYQTHQQPAADTSYYPKMSCHEGVVCDRCETHNIDGARYKCAFCADMDLCSSCFDEFLLQSAAADLSDSNAAGSLSSLPEVMADPITHHLNHLFLRIDVPVPIFAVKHFRSLKLDLDAIRCDRSEPETGVASALMCSDCGTNLNDVDIVYKCSNCFDPRFICAACLVNEEKCHNPHLMHAPGHLYFVVTKHWRSAFMPESPELQFRSLLHPPSIIPRLQYDRSTELFHMSIKCLHFGPMSTLSRWTTALKEARELQAFCACEEERIEYEKKQRRRLDPSSARRRRPLKFSSHYTASKTRFEELDAKVVKMELHLLDSLHVAEWLVFYGRASRWLLSIASVTQDPFAEVLSDFSAAFSSFPEHFFFDLCQATYLVGLDHVDYHEFMQRLKEEHGIEAEDQSLILEPLLVILTQLIIARGCTKNPHLRLEALRSLSSLLTFFSKSKHNRVLEELFEKNRLLHTYLVRGILQFHHEMDKYNSTNNGLAFNSAVSSGDHVLWGFLPTRISVTMLFRFLWQLPSQRRVMMDVFSADQTPVAAHAHPLIAQNVGQQLTGLVSGLWGDLAKLFDEGNTKIGILRQMNDLIESAMDGDVLVVPFRPAMLDGYIAIHSKHLRLTFRVLIELLELTSWMADSATLRRVMLKSELVEQGARTISFLISSLAQAYDEKSWAFSQPLLEDGKMMVSNLLILIVRFAGLNASCSPSSFWKVIRASGDAMCLRIGDLDALSRWHFNAVCTRLESDRYLDGSDDDMEAHTAFSLTGELNEDEALSVLEKQAAAAVVTSQSRATESNGSRSLSKRFIAELARDGRFDANKFSAAVAYLRSPTSTDLEDYEHVDPSWVQQFLAITSEAREMIQMQEAVESFLGEIPEQYLDPLLSTIMTNPVQLPSGNIVDRSVIERHLLASQNNGAGGVDPFTREPLTLEMLVPCDALRNEIRLYLQTKLRNFHKNARDDVLATWGLGWDYLFDADSEVAENAQAS